MLQEVRTAFCRWVRVFGGIHDATDSRFEDPFCAGWGPAVVVAGLQGDHDGGVLGLGPGHLQSDYFCVGFSGRSVSAIANTLPGTRQHDATNRRVWPRAHPTLCAEPDRPFKGSRLRNNRRPAMRRGGRLVLIGHEFQPFNTSSAKRGGSMRYSSGSMELDARPWVRPRSVEV